jgi:hypothetical protein
MMYPSYYYPDYTDDWEWRLNRYLANATMRGDAFEGLIGLLLVLSLLSCWLFLKFLFLLSRRMYDIYKTRANDATPGGTILKWSAPGLLLLWALVPLTAVIWPDWTGISFVVASAGLLAYTLLSEWVDYIASQEEAPPALPDNLSIQDIITWKNDVDTAAVGVPIEA